MSKSQPKVPNNLGSHFKGSFIGHRSYEERDHYRLLKDRTYHQQRLVDVQTLRDIGVYEGVHRLFSNIGWEGVLDLHPVNAYYHLTVEFLHCLSYKETSKTLSFRLLYKLCFLSLDALSEFVGAPTADTYGPGLGPGREKNKLFKAQDFWKQISGQEKYEARTAKASHIIHLVLKVAHRIIANVVYPQKGSQ